MAKKWKNCKKGYPCGGSCIRISYQCRKDFPEGVSISITLSSKSIYSKLAKPITIDDVQKGNLPIAGIAKVDNKRAKALESISKDVKSTLSIVDSNLAKDKGTGISAEKELVELKHRIKRKSGLSDDDKKSLIKGLDKKEKEVKAKIEKFKKEAKEKANKAKEEAKLKAAKAKAAAEMKAKEEAEKKAKEEEEAKAKAKAEKKAKEEEEVKEEAKAKADRERKVLKAIVAQAQAEIDRINNDMGYEYTRDFQKRVTRLADAIEAEDPKGYLKATRDLAKQDAEDQKKGMGYYERLENQKALQAKVNKAYYGEPENPRIFTPFTTRPPVGPEVPSTLPKGGATPEVKAFVDNAELLMQITPAAMKSVVSDSRFKNGLERGAIMQDDFPDNKDYWEERKKTEAKYMDIPIKSAASKRPIYAYLEHPDRSKSVGDKPEIGGFYGAFQVVFKPSVKERSTLSVGDSIEDYYKYKTDQKVTPISDPKFPSDKRHDGGPTAKSFRDKYNETVQYVEAQIYGKTTIDDIAEVRVPKNLSGLPVVNEMQDKGIKVVVIQPTRREEYVELDFIGEKDPI